MDAETIAAYENAAALYCAQYRLILPSELRQFAYAAFRTGQPTADIGCGSGRDVAWLNQHDFPTVGYDVSPAMLAEARLAYPNIDVRAEYLPELVSIADSSYANILCCATLMHLPAPELPAAFHNLARVLQPGGRLLFSVRSSQGSAMREADGRLFTPLSRDALTQRLDAVGMHILHMRDDADTYRKGITWLIVLAEKTAL